MKQQHCQPAGRWGGRLQWQQQQQQQQQVWTEQISPKAAGTKFDGQQGYPGYPG